MIFGPWKKRRYILLSTRVDLLIHKLTKKRKQIKVERKSCLTNTHPTPKWQNLLGDDTRTLFHGTADCRILRLRSPFYAYLPAPNFCASHVSVEYLVTRSTHVSKPKLLANPWNTLDVSTEFSASVSVNYLLTVSMQSHDIGPWWIESIQVNYSGPSFDATRYPNKNTCIPLVSQSLIAKLAMSRMTAAASKWIAINSQPLNLHTCLKHNDIKPRRNIWAVIIC